MGEMAQALKALGSIKDAWITENPNDTWGFVGRYDARLCYIKEDGTTPNDDEFKKLTSSNFPGMTMKILHIKKRVFSTKEAAIEAAIEAANAIGQAWKETIKP